MFALILSALLITSSSALSLRGFVENLNMAADDSAPSPFDVSACGKTKGCLFGPDNFDPPCVPGGSGDGACTMAFSFKPVDDQHVEMELWGTIETEDMSANNFYVAISFSTDDRMGDDAVTECSQLLNGQASVKASYNYYHDENAKSGPDNRRIEGEESVRPSIYSQSTLSTADGYIYCKFTQRIADIPNNNKVQNLLQTTLDTPYWHMLAKGTTNTTDILKHVHHRRAKSTRAFTFREGGSSTSTMSMFLAVAVTLIVRQWQ